MVKNIVQLKTVYVVRITTLIRACCKKYIRMSSKVQVFCKLLNNMLKKMKKLRDMFFIMRGLNMMQVFELFYYLFRVLGIGEDRPELCSFRHIRRHGSHYVVMLFIVDDSGADYDDRNNQESVEN